MPLYAYRLKGVRGDSWRIFRVKTDTLHGTLRKLAPSIPELPLTRNGKPYLNWNEGMELNQFVALICSQNELGKTNMKYLQTRTNNTSVNIGFDREIQLKPKVRTRDILAELQKRKV